MLLLYLAKYNALLSRYTTTPKRDKIPHTKNRNLLVHIIGLPTTVVEVDITSTNVN